MRLMRGMRTHGAAHLLASDLVRAVEGLAVENPLPHFLLHPAVVHARHHVLGQRKVLAAPMMKEAALGIEVCAAKVASDGLAMERLARPFMASTKHSVTRDIGFLLARWELMPGATEFLLPRDDGRRRKFPSKQREGVAPLLPAPAQMFTDVTQSGSANHVELILRDFGFA